MHIPHTRRLTAAALAVTLAGTGLSLSGPAGYANATTTTAVQSTKATAANASSCTYDIVSYHGPYDPFMAVVAKGVAAAGKQLGIHAVFEGPKELSDTQEANILASTVAAHPCGIAVLLSDPTDLTRSIDTAAKEHIAVILFNTQDFAPAAGGTISQLAYVGQDETKSGAKLASHLLDYLKPGDHVLYAIDFAGETVELFREAGVKSTLAKHGITTTPLLVGSDPVAGVSILQSYLATHPNINAIVSNGTPADQAVIDYIQKNHLKGKYIVAGFDMAPYVVTAIKDGIQAFALDQQPFLQGYLSVVDLYLKVHYGFTPVDINTGTLFVDRSNVNQFATLVSQGIGG